MKSYKLRIIGVVTVVLSCFCPHEGLAQMEKIICYDQYNGGVVAQFHAGVTGLVVKVEPRSNTFTLGISHLLFQKNAPIAGLQSVVINGVTCFTNIIGSGIVNGGNISEKYFFYEVIFPGIFDPDERRYGGELYFRYSTSSYEYSFPISFEIKSQIGLGGWLELNSKDKCVSSLFPVNTLCIGNNLKDTLIAHAYKIEEIRWERKVNSHWERIPGVQTLSYAFPPCPQNTTVRRCLKRSGTNFYSNEIIIPATSGGTIVANKTTINGCEKVTFSSSSLPDYPAGKYTFIWERKAGASAAWEDISGSNNAGFSEIVTATTVYRRAVKNADSRAYSNEITITSGSSPVTLNDKNYTLVSTYIQPGGSVSVKDITYTDGFGRKLQETAVSASPVDSKDIVQIYQYGIFGREDRKYLPFAKVRNTRLDALNPEPANWSAYGSDEQNYVYSKIEYDNSPLDRMVKTTGAGRAWHTAGKGVTVTYALNAANEVTLWRVAANGSLLNAGYYPPGALEKTTTVDEDGTTVAEFADNLGRTILTYTLNGSDKLQTYSVYDDRGLLRYVLTPEAIRQGISDAVILRYCYSYQYDARARQIEKRLPGVEPQRFVYDKKDRLVLSRDGNQRTSGKWSYSLYDYKNRVIEIGETTDVISEASVNASGNYIPFARTPFKFNYYDDYAFTGKHAFTPSKNISGITDYYPYTAGLLTGTSVRVLGTDKWVKTTIYYDNHCRKMQVISNLYIEGAVSVRKCYVSYHYDFIGNLLSQQECFENEQGGSDVLLTTYTYDARSRRLSQSTSLNNSPAASITLGYDELGRPVSKVFGNNTLTETTAYNVRGWLTGKSSNKFTMQLRYADAQRAPSAARFNGNISEWEWCQGAAPAQSYSFTYDPVNRLMNSNQYTRTGTTWNKTDQYAEYGLSYDHNGNIKTLKRNADGILHDNLTYTYTGNQLLSLSGISGTYLYDSNGNQTKDIRKNLELSYNILNLLNEARDNGTLMAKYQYAFDATKLSVRDGTGANGYDYRGSLTYKKENGAISLESASFGNGRILKTGSSYALHYHLTDHLGSVRVIFDNGGNTLAENDYYPFGQRHANPGSRETPTNRFLYNGKEAQRTGGLDYLDYGARMYDAGLGRWFGVDPLGEKYYDLSSYNYCTNNPLKYIDPDGKDLWLLTPKGGMILALATSERNAIYALDGNGNISAGFYGSNNDMFSQLANSDRFGRRKSIMSFDYKNEMLRLFYFVADNTEVEWSFSISKSNKVGIATKGDEGWTPFAFEPKDIRIGVHSHVKTNGLKDEMDNLDGDKIERNKGTFPFNYYIYMKNSGNLFKLDQMNREHLVKTMNLNTTLYHNGVFKKSYLLPSEKVASSLKFRFFK